MLTRDNALEIARGSGWLSRQPARFQDELLSRCHLRSYREKETIYHVGDPLHRGVLPRFRPIRVEFAATGGDYKVASVRQPVSWFGQDACFRRGGHLLTMSAAVPVTALQLTPPEFERLIENPGLLPRLRAPHSRAGRRRVAGDGPDADWRRRAQDRRAAVIAGRAHGQGFARRHSRYPVRSRGNVRAEPPHGAAGAGQP